MFQNFSEQESSHKQERSWSLKNETPLISDKDIMPLNHFYTLFCRFNRIFPLHYADTPLTLHCNCWESWFNTTSPLERTLPVKLILLKTEGKTTEKISILVYGAKNACSVANAI